MQDQIPLVCGEQGYVKFDKVGTTLIKVLNGSHNLVVVGSGRRESRVVEIAEGRRFAKSEYVFTQWGAR